jgi:hypothetical protein
LHKLKNKQVGPMLENLIMQEAYSFYNHENVSGNVTEYM